MRKVILIYIGLIFLCFLLPAVLTSPFEQTSSIVKNNEQIETQKTHTIKLFHTANDTVEEMNLEEYLYGVVSAEMPASYAEEALKAQAIVARTYTIYKEKNDPVKHGEASICDNSSCCQAWISKEDRLAKWDEDKKNEYWNKIVSAVDSTKGKIIMYEGEPINAFFHSNSGGTTEAPVNVWRGNWVPIFTNGCNCWRRRLFSIQIRNIFNKNGSSRKIKTKSSGSRDKF